MANQFEIVGKLSIGKETEKFVPHEQTSFPSGWGKSRLLFNVQSESNRHLLTSEGMYKEDGTGTVYSFTKGKVDDVTKVKTKGEPIQIKWSDRNKPEVISKIAEFKKFVFDTEVTGRRYAIEKALEKQKKGEDVTEELEELGVTDLEQALEESKKKRKEFITQYDFTEFLAKLLKSEKLKNKKFRVLGNIIHSEYNGKVYKKLEPTRIYLVPDDEPEISVGQVTVFFNKESLDKASFKDTGKLYVNGFVRDYDGNRKEDVPCAIQLVIDGSNQDEKIQKFTKLLESQFTVTDKSWKEFGVKVKLLDGSQKMDITPEMLTDTQKELLELEIITIDDIRKELKGDLYGDKVQEMVVVNVIKGYTSGRKDTVYTDKDFVVKPSENVSKPKQDVKKDAEEDLFGDLEEDLF